ncbi:MAG: hypothetical protein ACRYFX_08760 [Janthinobacterium lividum]
MALLDAITRFVDEFNHNNNLGTLLVSPAERAVPPDLLPAGQLRTFYAKVEFEKLIIRLVAMLN